MSDSPLAIIYRIDGEDRLCHVNQGWIEFARANASGGGLAEAQIIGRSLWDSIEDETTRELYQRMVRRARQRQEVRFTFRCDSPQERRRFRMTITAAQAKEVQFCAEVESSESRPEVSWLVPGQLRGRRLVYMCSWCGLVKLTEGEWVEVEVAMERHSHFGHTELPLLSHGMCEKCYAAFHRTIESETGTGK